MAVSDCQEFGETRGEYPAKVRQGQEESEFCWF